MGNAKKKQNQKASQAKRKETPTLHNRKAYHEFEIQVTLLAGLVLTGTEVKSLRLGRGQLGEGFIRFDKAGEAWLYGVTIPQYEFGNRYNHDPTRIRKVLLNSREIQKWRSQVERENLTVIPLKLFFRNSWVKLEIGLAKRKLKEDKRRDLKDKAIQRDMEREFKQRS
ncbi:MAG: SsrA-binding protein SmpB [Candidatus Caenarcaniphilales bacterium]|nr:SsrA-binding protein SmpB [Candidatus Caenarcaniphilales bacterium]